MAFKQIHKFNSRNIVNAHFGYTISIDGDYIIGGETRSAVSRIYVYKKGVNKLWSQIDWSSYGSGVKRDVSIKEGWIMTGSEGASTNTGEVRFYQKDSAAETWTRIIALDLTGSNTNEFFGNSVDLKENYGIIGAKGVSSNEGRSYIVKRDFDIWSILASAGTAGEIKPENVQTSGDLFGISVGISGDWVVVGAEGETNNTGSIYIFNKNEGGVDYWGMTERLVALDGEENDKFGSSVAISGDYLVVGAKNKNLSSSEVFAGAAYVFKLVGSSWSQIVKLIPTEETNYETNSFGTSVGISNNYVVVGSPGARTNMGVVNIFSKNSNWGHFQKIVADDSSVANGSEFGWDVAVDRNIVIVGAYKDDGDGTERGATYVFEQPEIALRLAQEFDVSGEYVPTKASIYLKRIGSNLNDNWSLSITDENVIDSTNFSDITLQTNKIIFDNRVNNFTGNGYMILAPYDELIIPTDAVENDFSVINYPISVLDPATFNFWIRCFLDGDTSDPSYMSFKMDILLDGIIIKTFDELVSQDEWFWLGDSITLPDTNEHILGIRLKERNCAIDKLYFKVGDNNIPYADGPAYSESPYLTIHMKVYETFGQLIPVYPLFVYDYKNSINEIVQDDWYNFNITILDDRILYFSAVDFLDKYFIVLAVTGSNQNNFVVWEFVDNDEYRSELSALKLL